MVCLVQQDFNLGLLIPGSFPQDTLVQEVWVRPFCISNSAPNPHTQLILMQMALKH